MFIHKVLLATAGIFTSFAAAQALGGEIFLECQPESTSTIPHPPNNIPI